MTIENPRIKTNKLKPNLQVIGDSDFCIIIDLNDAASIQRGIEISGGTLMLRDIEKLNGVEEEPETSDQLLDDSD